MSINKALADAFDKAAITCDTKEYAARFIIAELHKAGFAIVPMKDNIAESMDRVNDLRRKKRA